MYSHEAANVFTDKIGVKRDSAINSQVRHMIEIEAEEAISSGSLRGQRNQYDKGVTLALNRMIEWWDTALEYHFESYHEFVSSHRRACIYVVLLRRQGLGLPNND